MENYEFRKVQIKNCKWHYFDDIIKLEVVDEKSHENILVYDISYATLIDSKLLCIRFDKIDGFIRIYDRTRYLTLFGSGKYVFYNRIRYLVSQKSGITYIFSHFTKMSIDYYDSLTIEKRLTLCNIIIHIKAVLNKDKITTTIRYFEKKACIS